MFQITCPTCKSSGKIVQPAELRIGDIPCPTCEGYGYLNIMPRVNGWTNYPTFAVYNWIGNDPALNALVRRICKAEQSASYAEEKLKEFIAVHRKGYFVSGNHITSQMFGDMLNNSIAWIDWYELAEAFRE